MTRIALVVSSSDPVPSGVIRLRWEGASAEVIADVHELWRREPPDAALDFLALALGAFSADKAVLRSETRDRWTRNIELWVPQIDPARLRTDLANRLLGHLTGDRWDVHTYHSTSVRGRLLRSARSSASEPAEVALFSGGLDSFAFAASRTDALTLVAHQERSPLAPLQGALAMAIGQHTTLRRDLRHFSAMVSARVLGSSIESSTRSRSLLFFAAAVSVAAAEGAATVVVPENGFISLNPPMTPARRGTLSTRTTHPLTMSRVNELLDATGLDVTLVNPYQLATKGEVTSAALRAAPADLVFSTVSCSKPHTRTGEIPHFANCGSCFPCLVRRAGFEAAGVDDGSVYRSDIRRDHESVLRPAGDDLRAVASRVRRPFTLSDLVAGSRLPPGTQHEALLDLLERSRVELRDSIDNGITPRVRTTLGW